MRMRLLLAGVLLAALCGCLPPDMNEGSPLLNLASKLGDFIF